MTNGMADRQTHFNLGYLVTTEEGKRKYAYTKIVTKPYAPRFPCVWMVKLNAAKDAIDYVKTRADGFENKLLDRLKIADKKTGKGTNTVEGKFNAAKNSVETMLQRLRIARIRIGCAERAAILPEDAAMVAEVKMRFLEIEKIVLSLLVRINEMHAKRQVDSGL